MSKLVPDGGASSIFERHSFHLVSWSSCTKHKPLWEISSAQLIQPSRSDPGRYMSKDSFPIGGEQDNGCDNETKYEENQQRNGAPQHFLSLLLLSLSVGEKERWRWLENLRGFALATHLLQFHGSPVSDTYSDLECICFELKKIEDDWWKLVSVI